MNNAKYKCWFPDCKYETDKKSLIEFHHMTPREINPSPLNKVVIPLCPTCHKLIYHPLVKCGQHTLNTEKSIQILGKYKSTTGWTIHYMDYYGAKWFYDPDDGQKIKDITILP